MSLANLDKLNIVVHVEAKRTGRRTYVNLPDLEVKACRIEPGDLLKIKIVEVHRKDEGEAE